MVAASLALSGALTWVLVRGLVFENAQQQLNRSVLVLRPQVIASECLVRTATGGGCTVPAATPAEFSDALASRLGSLSGDRLIVLDRASGEPGVLFDSAGRLPRGSGIQLSSSGHLPGDFAAEGTATVGGERYLVSAVRIQPRLTRLAGIVILARLRQQVANEATAQLIPPIMEAFALALGLAVAVTLLLSRTFTRSLRELRGGAEDIAAGNYSRRVGVTGQDEIGVVGAAFNRMAEAVERARALQRDFLANVSHELKTPLTSLIGFSQALMDGSLQTDQEKLRAATILHEEARRVLRMSQELLDLARVESRQLVFHPQPVDLGAQLEQEIELVRPRAASRGLELRLILPPAVPPVRADPERLHQILDNLLDNAVKYAPAGSAVAIQVEHLGLRVATSVRNAVGAHPPDPSRMFERFYRADPSRSTAAGGVGLGLAISRELAVAQEGELMATLAGDQLQMRLELPVDASEAAVRATVRLGTSGASGAPA